jgi:hypothetical protein
VVAVRGARRESSHHRTERQQRHDGDHGLANARWNSFERPEQEPDHAPTAATAREISDTSGTSG